MKFPSQFSPLPPQPPPVRQHFSPGTNTCFALMSLRIIDLFCFFLNYHLKKKVISRKDKEWVSELKGQLKNRISTRMGTSISWSQGAGPKGESRWLNSHLLTLRSLYSKKRSDRLRLGLQPSSWLESWSTCDWHSHQVTYTGMGVIAWCLCQRRASGCRAGGNINRSL